LSLIEKYEELMKTRTEHSQTRPGARPPGHMQLCHRLCMVLVRLSAAVAALLLILFSFERPAQAYTDPGSGALIWQMVAAGFVGAAFYFRRFMNWIKGRRASKQHDGGEQAEDGPTRRHETES
jgi:hypothetical protein